MASANSVLYIILLIIVIVGALNWGAVALNNERTNPQGCGGFVGRIFKTKSQQKVVYGIVGVSGVLLIGLSLFDAAEKNKKKKLY